MSARIVETRVECRAMHEQVQIDSSSTEQGADQRVRRFRLPDEEVANSISHGLGLIAAIAAVPILVLSAARDGSTSYVFGVGVFAVSVVLLYLASTLYHALTHDRAKEVFRLLDHSAIFLLIAGTYTPFTLGVLRGPWGWSLLVAVWTLATIGLTLKAVFGIKYRWPSMALYVVMGWLAIIAIRPIWLQIPLPGILLVAGGGIAYTGGLAFFAMHRIRYNHFIWHLFVLIGTTCHFLAVLWYSKQ